MAKHLNFVERGVLYRLRMEGKGQAEIARVLGRHPSTICRELQRNTGGRGYRPQQAQRKADERRLQCRRPRKMDDPRVKAYVQRRLNWFWSPDQIAHCAESDFSRDPAYQLSHQTIYNWIEQQEDRREWKQCLRRGGRRLGPTKRGQLPACVSIEGRPKIVDGRRRYGDWEGDTVVGKGRRSGVLTAVERKSGYLCAAKLKSLQSDAVIQARGGGWARCRRSCDARRPSTTVRSLPNMRSWLSCWNCKSSLPNLTVPGSAARMKTPTDCSGSSFPKALTSRGSAIARWPARRNYLTNVPAGASVIEHPLKSLPRNCIAIDS